MFWSTRRVDLLRYTISRLLGSIPTILVIISLAFMLLHAAPGGPFDSQKKIPPEIKKNIERKYHLDEPLYRQYLRYLGGILQGDLGPSYQYRDTTVNEIIRQGFPVDIVIGGFALGGALLIGLPIGMISALRRGTGWDYVPMGLSMIGISLPVFIIAPILILVFAVDLRWLPAGGWTGSFLKVVLPAAALSAPYIAYVARLMRGSMVEVLNSPFILMSRAKGVPTRLLILRHALKPAMMPLVSFLGPAVAGVITGSIVIETIFGLPGIGRAFVDGALNRDYTLVLGVTVLYGVLIVLFNLLADLSYSLLDPRVRY
jgi:oligopeptide transport system permease protein